jgi:hypothetical protein
MSTVNYAVVAERLTSERLGSYLAGSGGALEPAIALYDWNVEVGGALHEDIGRLEVVFRNALDRALVDYAASQGWSVPWYRRTQLFPGRHGRRAQDEIATARQRANRRGTQEKHGKVIAELSLGFWRYLCTPAYLTSLWVPALAAAFPGHPDARDPRAVRADVEDRIQRIRFLRNRIAHHEPVHKRNLHWDHRSILELTCWICVDTQAWISSVSRSLDVLDRRPRAIDHQVDDER